MDTKVNVALLLEDEVLIAMDVEYNLAQAGFDVTTVSTCADALDWLEDCRPDVVIVDIILKDGPCHEIVAKLLEDGIPFIVHSGDHPTEYAGTPFAGGTWVSKPANGAKMVEAARLLAAA